MYESYPDHQDADDWNPCVGDIILHAVVTVAVLRALLLGVKHTSTAFQTDLAVAE